MPPIDPEQGQVDLRLRDDAPIPKTARRLHKETGIPLSRCQRILHAKQLSTYSLARLEEVYQCGFDALVERYRRYAPTDPRRLAAAMKQASIYDVPAGVPILPATLLASLTPEQRAMLTGTPPANEPTALTNSIGLDPFVARPAEIDPEPPKPGHRPFLPPLLIDPPAGKSGGKKYRKMVDQANAEWDAECFPIDATEVKRAQWEYRETERATLARLKAADAPFTVAEAQKLALMRIDAERLCDAHVWTKSEHTARGRELVAELLRRHNP